MLDVASKAFFQTLSRSRTLKTLASRCGMSGPRAFARRFIAETVDAAIEAVREIQAQGLTSTLDYLGESVTSLAAADTATREYLQLIDAVDRAGVERNLSLKLTQLGLDVDRAICKSTICEKYSSVPNSAAFRPHRYGELGLHRRDARHLRGGVEARASRRGHRSAIVPVSYGEGLRGCERAGRAHPPCESVPRAEECGVLSSNRTSTTPT